MPLIKRAISPVDVSRGCVPPNFTKDELQCVANGTLANLIRQLSSLSRHAEHIVGDIYHEAMKLDHKSNLLQQRIERLTSKVELLDSNNEQACLEQLHMRKAFKSSMLVDQHTLDRATLPPALVEVYDKCDPPPNLDALNPYRDDPNNALSLYTNPGFFFDLWRKEMLKDVGDTRRKVKSPEGQKSPKKKRRPQEHQHNAPRANIQNRYAPSARLPPMGALSFPEEYQAPQSLGLQLHKNVGYQPVHSSAPVVPPPGMSVRAPPMLIERNDIRSSMSPPRENTKRDFPLPDMSILAIDDDDELPPPPPPLMHTSIVQHMPSTQQNTMQFVPSEGQQAPAVPPPPPPPPPNLMAPKAAATFAAPRQETTPSAAPQPKNDPRGDLLAQIRQGFDLRKTRRAEEENQEREAAEQNDVAAILRKRMQQVRTVHEDDDSQGSAEYDDGEWDD